LLPAGLFVGLQAYPVDNPIWSLFFELLANAFYGIRLLRRNVVWISLTILCAIILAVAAASVGTIDHFGFNSPATFPLGLPRVIVPFAIGAALYHLKLHHRFSGFWSAIPPLLLVGALYYSSHPGWIFDLIATMILFPLIVSTAAGARLGPSAMKLSWLSGELSYPAYLIHQPILRALSAAGQFAHVRLPYHLAAAIGIPAALGLSWLLLKYVDKPARRALDRRFLQDRNQRELLLQPAL
jgi:peptidoglycan/LPS O-acetylase OafA/YrhL